MIISDQEMARIQQTVRISTGENLRYRALAKYLFNVTDPKDLSDRVRKMRDRENALHRENNEYRTALETLAKNGNIIAKAALRS